MQTIINWTRYDGTEATLPMTKEEYAIKENTETGITSPRWQSFLLSRDGRTIECPVYMWLDDEDWFWSSSDYPFMPIEIGDFWAPWPTAPQE